MMARTTRRPSAKIDFSDRDATRRWFERQPRQAAIAMVVREALRFLPMTIRAKAAASFEARILLPVFRALVVGWVAAEFPASAERLRAAGLFATHDALA